MQTPAAEADILQQPYLENDKTREALFKRNEGLDCSLFMADQISFLVIVIGWTLVLISYVALNCKLKNHVTLLQKVLIILPILKLVDTFSYYLFLKQCPWTTEKTEFATKYLIMALVTISSIYQSIAIGIIMLLSSGWSLLMNRMDREYATKITVFMGVTYLAYSAYYVSLPDSAFRVFMEIFLTFCYGYIFYFCLKSLTNMLSMLNRVNKYMQDNNVVYLIRATKLKYSMLHTFKFVLVLFFCTQMAFQGIIPLILEYMEKSLYFTTMLDLTQQIFDFLIYAALLTNYRVRVWPEYFDIASFELGNIDDLIEENSRSKVPKMFDAKFTKSFMSSSCQTCKTEYEDMILNSVEEDTESNLKGMNVVLLNPSYDSDDSIVYPHLTMAKKVSLSTVDRTKDRDEK